MFPDPQQGDRKIQDPLTNNNPNTHMHSHSLCRACMHAGLIVCITQTSSSIIESKHPAEIFRPALNPTSQAEEPWWESAHCWNVKWGPTQIQTHAQVLYTQTLQEKKKVEMSVFNFLAFHSDVFSYLTSAYFCYWSYIIYLLFVPLLYFFSVATIWFSLSRSHCRHQTCVAWASGWMKEGGEGEGDDLLQL